jgi:hypothetical protein
VVSLSVTDVLIIGYTVLMSPKRAKQLHVCTLLFMLVIAYVVDGQK